MARSHHPGALALIRRQFQPARRDRAGDIIGLHLGHVGAELPERLADFALEARLDGGLQAGIALAQDLVRHLGLHARLLKLAEGFAGIDGVELLRIAHQHQLRDAPLPCNPEQVAGLHGGGQRPFVDHQHGPGERRAHLLRALLRQPALGDAGVPREESLQGLALDARFRRQDSRRRGRRRETDQVPAPFLRERAGAVQHPGLARPSIALYPDRAIAPGQDELHRVPLPGRERSLVQMPVHPPTAHRRLAPVRAGTRQHDGLALVGQPPCRW